MTTLTQAAITTRKVIRYSVFAIIALIVGRILLFGAIGVYRYFFPEPPPPPTVAFGKLPSLPFPEGKTTQGISFTLETPEGGLPRLPEQARVYFMPKLSPNLLSLDAAITKAESLGFRPEAQKISDTLYKFPGRDNPSELQVNIITGAFSISYDLSSDSSPIEKIPPAAEVAASKIRAFLSGADLLPEDLTGETFPAFLKIEEGKLTPSLGQSDADLVKVNFLRKDYDELPAVTQDPSEANVWFMVTGAGDKNKQTAFAQYYYFPVDEGQSSTYPLKPPQTAWEELVAGGGFLARASANPGVVTIRRVYLAYFDPKTQADFYQPVYVFEGDAGFVAYIPAVSTEYYGE